MTMIFAGKEKCGCVVAVCKDGFDNPAFVDLTIDALAEMRSDGLTIEKMESDVAFDLMKKRCFCSVPLFAEAETI